ncbi:peroxide stress protein YaaA [Saccharopolyspora erythraea]|uniref:peroxide stress protein YaaA n=1 Tax=Saccharopolyspora erythraea TaxID=1836 RepID=UPI001BA63259|nr:peroxide stress protein YaaA [Saccharopolyspora erythraea]QUH04427.1 peroxide stress protein YaaA [Saccharopolyspora erythraea]
MLVLLPPSETKAVGGDGGPLDLEALSHPELNPARRELIDALRALADDVPASLDALGLSQRQAEEVQRNAELLRSPTAPALERYTGVLYDALDVGSLSAAERKQADSRLAVASALFGLARGTDAIPAYRLSGGSSLPGLPPLRSMWRPVLEPLLADVDDLVVDLRSGAYATLARVPHAVKVRVLSEDAGGKRKVVSHHNKAHKGKLARALAQAPAEPADVGELLAVAEAAGLRVEREAERELCVVVSA